MRVDMAEAAVHPTAAGAAPSFFKRLIRLAGVAVLCLAALTGGLVASLGMDRVSAMFGGGPAPVAAPEDHAPKDSHAQPAPKGDGHGAPADGHGAPAKGKIVVTPFKEIIVNITATTATGRQTSRFLKLNVALAYDETYPNAANIAERTLFLRDSFQDYLRQLNEVDLQGSIGLVRLKQELLRRARAISESDAPQEILIADLIVQ